MARTYEIVQTPGGTWQILSNGKPLRWYYRHLSYAEGVVEELKQKDADRRERAIWRKKNGIKPPPRDSKRRKAYAAERAAGLKDEPPYNATTARMAANCVRWAQMAGLKPVVPQVRITRRKKGGAHAWVNQITLSPRSSLSTLVHEYAHVITWEERPAHGPQWAAAYVALVRVAYGADLGPIMANRLEHEFRKIDLWPVAQAS